MYSRGKSEHKAPPKIPSYEGEMIKTPGGVLNFPMKVSCKYSVGCRGCVGLYLKGNPKGSNRAANE